MTTREGWKAALLAKINKRKAALARDRDALRVILADVEAVLESTDRAVEALDDCVDALSEYL